MKTLMIPVACLFWASLAAGRSVEVLSVQPSSQHVRISASNNGNSLNGANLQVFGGDGASPSREQLFASLTTDVHGVAVLPKLSPGHYHIVATAGGGLQADLLLDVSRRKGKETSSFSLELIVKPPPPPTLEEMIDAAESVASGESLQEFKGIVMDPSGTGVPAVQIEIFHKGSKGVTRVAKTKSDAMGHFSVHLAAAPYAATFQCQGFSTGIHIFEIKEDGDQKELRFVLRVGASTE